LGSFSFQAILDSLKSDSALCAEYVKSPAVKDQSETGVCIDISRTLPQTTHRRPTQQEDQIEGRLKIHIVFEGRGCGEDKLEQAYNLVLSLLQEFRSTKQNL
jgi:hypothetical protein